ncbi:hypothetical protein LMG29542_08448 [Paraburkholderia humisilvae]|uniref:Uncharacterized protein n=1 Tax=Paraburkholderia humisilvae TaxID=627669 RepID=A0A6J5FCS0_9BURK|nr:hypothetical protein LMG29542_08448 [Paraburkholderia humisilvae]
MKLTLLEPIDDQRLCRAKRFRRGKEAGQAKMICEGRLTEPTSKTVLLIIAGLPSVRIERLA